MRRWIRTAAAVLVAASFLSALPVSAYALDESATDESSEAAQPAEKAVGAQDDAQDGKAPAAEGNEMPSAAPSVKNESESSSSEQSKQSEVSGSDVDDKASTPEFDEKQAYTQSGGKAQGRANAQPWNNWDGTATGNVCLWYMDGTVLHVESKNGSQCDAGATKKSSDVPWRAYRTQITAVETPQGNTITLAANSAFLFQGCENLADISGMRYWDVNNMTSAFRMFDGCAKLSDITPLEAWKQKTYHLTEVQGLFRGSGITSLTGTEGWDLRSVKSFAKSGKKILSMIGNCTQLTDTGAMRTWAVDKDNADFTDFFEGDTALQKIGVPGIYWQGGTTFLAQAKESELASLVPLVRLVYPAGTPMGPYTWKQVQEASQNNANNGVFGDGTVWERTQTNLSQLPETGEHDLLWVVGVFSAAIVVIGVTVATNRPRDGHARTTHGRGTR